jgi:hypothetical protein
MLIVAWIVNLDTRIRYNQAVFFLVFQGTYQGQTAILSQSQIDVPPHTDNILTEGLGIKHDAGQVLKPDSKCGRNQSRIRPD